MDARQTVLHSLFQETENSTSPSGSSVVRELKRKDQTLVVMDLPIEQIQARIGHFQLIYRVIVLE